MRCALLTVCCGVAVVLANACSTTAARTVPAEPGLDVRDPLSATILMQQGQILVSEGKLQAGMDKYQAAMKLQPQNPTVYNLMGLAQLQRGDPAQAVTLFGRALELAPSYSDARNNRGVAYEKLGQTALAEGDFLTVLADREYENLTGVYFNLGSLYLAKGNFAGAEDNLRKAATAAGPVEAFVLLGDVEDKLGKPDRAESALRDAMTRAPERPDVMLALAEFLDRHGRTGEARALYQRILTLAPNSAEATQAKARVGR